MDITMKNKHRVHSYTAIAQFIKCPRQYKEVRLEKRYPYEQSEEAKWGDYVHNCLEAAITKGEALPDNASQYQFLVDAVNERANKGWYIHCEKTFALDKTLTRAYYDSRKEVWWSPEYAFAGKIDLLMVSPDTTEVVIADWKTNKSAKYAEPDQLEIYALGVLLTSADIKQVETSLIFICDQFKLVKATYTREDIPRLQRKWLNKLGQLNAAIQADNFPESTYTPLCGWCPCKDCPNWQQGQDYMAFRKKKGR